MPQMQLTLDNLKDFDYGKASVAWQKALAAVVRDCLDRPGERATREVTLKTLVVPVNEQDGDVVDASVEFVIQTKLPARKTAARPMITGRTGQLFFSGLSPNDPRQKTIDDAADLDGDE